MKKMYFLSSMPRSGSTLTANILAQNPKFHSTATSALLDVLFSVRNNWNNYIEHKAGPCPEKLPRVLRSIVSAYYEDIKKPVIIEKSRGHLAYINLWEQILKQPVKILCNIRPIPHILASFEKLYRETSKTQQPPGEKENYFQFQTVEGRCAYWVRNDQPVGLALNRFNDAMQSGHKNKIHIIPFNDLTTNPEITMKKVYEFLEEPYFPHDFDNVEQSTNEDDTAYGFVNLHKIRNRVEPVMNDSVAVLGEALVKKYAQ